MSSPATAHAVTPRTKSPEAFRTISEASDMLDVPQHVLRFWESRFSQVKPVKRAGGRRFYRPEDVDLLRGIRSLLYFEGYTIKGVQKVLRERGVRYVAEIGRGKTAAFGAPAEMPVVEDIDEDRAAAAFASLARVHEEVKVTLDEHRRVDLELLLAELLQLKAKLTKASGAAV